MYHRRRRIVIINEKEGWCKGSNHLRIIIVVALS